MLILDLLYPKACPLCGKTLKRNYKNALCESCASDSKIIFEHTSDIKHILPHCKNFTCVFRYTDRVREAILKYKFQGEIWRAKPFAELINRNILRQGGYDAYDAAAYVPVNKRSMKTRGYDQTLEILKELCKKAEIPYVTVISKKSEAGDNALERKSREMRISESKYEPKAKAPDIKGKNILLLDDVLTTGATLRECTNILLNSGAASVSCAVLASGRGDIE